MNILVVTHGLPLPAGGLGARNYHFLRALAQEHTVSVLAIIDPGEEVGRDLAPLTSITRTLRIITAPALGHKRLHQMADLARGRSHVLSVYSPKEAGAALDDLLASEPCDVVLFESVKVAGHRVPERVRVVIDQHNIESEIVRRTFEQERSPIRRGYSWLEWCALRPREIARCRRADLILVTSERERRILQEHLPDRAIRTVPNGVDVETFRPAETACEVPGRIVFTGAINYYPNTHGVLSFAQQCWQQIKAAVPNASWEIVGMDPPPAVQRLGELPDVTVTGTVPDVRPHLAAAEVAIVPLAIGSGTRLKILDAWAMGKAVVSTSLGCEGLDARPGEHLLVADGADQFVAAVVTLLRDAAQRSAIGAAGRRFVEEHYSWQQSGTELLRLVASMNSYVGRSI